MVSTLRRFSRASSAFLAVLALPALAFTQIQISTVADLIAVNDNLSGDYVLMNDIDLTGVAFPMIGTDADPFIGTFDGQGRKIQNLDLFFTGGLGATGFFGAVDGGTLDRIVMDNPTVFAGTNVGSLAGKVSNSEVTRCSVLGGSISGIQSVGGLIGFTAGTNLSFCKASTDVEGFGRWAGGLIGHAHLGTFLNTCKNKGTVTGSDSVGGLTGNLHASLAINCRSYASVSGARVVGGFTGWLQENLLTDPPQASAIIDCYAYGDVYGSSGGIVTFNDPAGNLVIASGSNGGLVGWADDGSAVWNCHAYGDVEGPTQQHGPLSGGLLGRTDPNCTVTDCTANGAVLGGSTCGGLIAWVMDDTLIENCVANGDVNGVWQTGGLVGAFERGNIQNCHAHGDVTAPGQPNGHGDPGRLVAATGGLVGYSFRGDDAFPCNIFQSSATGNVTTTGQFTGGLVGLSWGLRVSQSFATGEVTSNERRLGGLIGAAVITIGEGDGLFQRSEYLNCYATGAVSQVNPDLGFDGMVGGLVGEVQSNTVSDQCHLHRSYAASLLSGSGTVGGLVGEAGANFAYHPCYWDTEVSGVSTSAIGEGRTTAEMFTESNYFGWFFPSVWVIDEGNGYPTLAWQ